MLLVSLLLACSTTEGTPVGEVVLNYSAASAGPGGTPVTHNAPVQICNGDASVELSTTSVVTGELARITGVKGTLTKNTGWAVSTTSEKPSVEGGQQVFGATFVCKRNDTSSKRTRETPVRVHADGKVENLQVLP